MKPNTDSFDFEVTLTPDELWQRITTASDEKKIAFFRPSGFEGNQPFLYETEGPQIKVHRRERRKNFPPILTMKILPTGYGSRITGNIAVEPSSWIFLILMFGIFLIIGGILTFFTISKILTGTGAANFSPFDFVTLIFLINAFILPIIFIVKVRGDKKKLFDWIKNLTTDSLRVK